MAVSITLLSFNYINLKKEKVFNEMNLEYFTLATPVIEKVGDNQEDNLTVEANESKKENYINYFIGNLEIPKINLNRGFIDPSSKENNVEKNLTIVNTSDMPDVENGNFILAAHSGTSYVSYFNKLYLLELGDKAYINYNNVKYTYEIKKIYYQEKTGKIGVYRDHEKSTLTLVTCTKDDKSKQTIYILEQVSKN